jgi:hypothetical protein
VIHNLPLNYTPYKELILCGNTLRDVRVPIMVNQFPVFLLGSNQNSQKLMVWLAAPLNKDATQWRFVVEGGENTSPQILLVPEHSAHILKVYVGSTLILDAEQMTPDKAIVRILDLRPIGLSIFGDQTTLHVASQTLTHNTFVNSNTMIAIGQ